VFGLSSILGPLVGGWITENVSWRWIFYVNLPVGILALLVLIFLMPSVGKKSKTAAIDYLGAALLIMATVPMLLGFTWAGGQYPWLSPQIIGLFVGSLIAFVAFFVYEAYLERRERQPIIDPSLFKNQTFSLSVMITMITSMGMFGAIFFLPLFAQGVLNISATNSGLQLTPLMLALICSSIISGQLVSRFGKYKWIAITGMFIAAAGSLLLLRLDIQSTIVDLLAAMIVLGLGLGFSMALYTLIVQNAMPHKLGQATATLSFFRQIGGTVALAALGSVMSTSYVPNFHNALPNMVKSLVPPDKLTAFDNPNILLSPEIQRQVQQAFATFGPAGQQLYKAIMGAVKIGLAQGIHNTFIFSVALMAIGLVLVCFIKEVPLRGGAARRRETNTDNAPDTTAEVEPVAIR
ncbi:MAG: MFS transporter, partial [Ktedonobacteraceae bacterium]|nr:MFS transporter [Ktedonobacteraceae bacterium]